MNSTVNYSCFDKSGLSHDSITAEYWNSKGTPYRDTALVSATVTMCFILVGIPSNLLIIVNIMWQRLFREPTYIVLLNLAIADLLMCVLVMPFTVISGFAGGFIFGSTDVIRCGVCQLVVLLTHFAILTIYILALLSIDRFIFIKYALKYNKIVTGKYYHVACTCLWIFCFVTSILPLFGFGDLVFRIEVSACSINYFEETSVTSNLNYSIFLAVIVIPPLSTIFVTSAWVLCIVQKQMRKIYSTKKESHIDGEAFSRQIQKELRNSKHSKQLRLVKVFGAIWISNLITWTPFLIRVFGIVIYGDRVLSKWIHLISFLSTTSFAFLHPIIEASFIPELRKILVSLVGRLICWKKKCSRSSTSNNKLANKCCKCKRLLECLDYLNASVLPITEESNING